MIDLCIPYGFFILPRVPVKCTFWHREVGGGLDNIPLFILFIYNFPLSYHIYMFHCSGAVQVGDVTLITHQRLPPHP